MKGLGTAHTLGSFGGSRVRLSMGEATGCPENEEGGVERTEATDDDEEVVEES